MNHRISLKLAWHSSHEPESLLSPTQRTLVGNAASDSIRCLLQSWDPSHRRSHAQSSANRAGLLGSCKTGWPIGILESAQTAYSVAKNKYWFCLARMSAGTDLEPYKVAEHACLLLLYWVPMIFVVCWFSCHHLGGSIQILEEAFCRSNSSSQRYEC